MQENILGLLGKRSQGCTAWQEEKTVWGCFHSWGPGGRRNGLQHGLSPGLFPQYLSPDFILTSENSPWGGNNSHCQNSVSQIESFSSQAQKAIPRRDASIQTTVSLSLCSSVCLSLPCLFLQSSRPHPFQLPAWATSTQLSLSYKQSWAKTN